MHRYLRILIVVPCLALLGLGGCDSKTEDTTYIDTIGPMSSIEAPGEDFVMDLDVVEKVEKPVVRAEELQEIINPPVVRTEEPQVTTEIVTQVVYIVDGDNDQVDDMYDNCLRWFNPTQVDTDHDGLGNECDGSPYGDGLIDTDQDGITDQSDNCPEIYNPDQEKTHPCLGG
jgi:hypothetical protein